LVFAENLYPVGGSLSNKNNEIVEFLNISCGNPNVKNEVVGCRKTYVEIKPSIEKLLSLEELAAIAKRDSLDVETFLAICEEMEPIFAYTDGKSVGGRTITPDERKEIESQTAAMGYDIDIISSMKTFCKSPSNHRIVQLMNQMQIAESKICKVESYTLAEMEYKLDPISGKFIRSEVVSGICDQYNLTEILTLDQFGLGTISLLERKMTFIQQRAKGDDRKAFNCDAPDEYEDKIYSSERTYSPLKCESFIGQ
jgi:hypothetical protein